MRRSLLETARDSRAIRQVAGKVLGVGALHALAQRFYGGLGSIVVLHRVVRTPAEITPLPGFGGEIDAAFLREILAFCRARGVAVVSLDEAAERVASSRKTRSRERFVVFTFDDGWRDNLTCALPIFREYGAPLAIYVATGFPDREPLAWKYNLADLLFSRTELRFEANGKAHAFDLSTPAGKDAAYRAIVKLVISSPSQARTGVLGAIADEASLTRKADELGLDWGQIRALAGDPLVTIGAHTHHHHNLALLDEAQLEAEVSGSKQRLEEALGKRVDHFAYPYGGKSHAGPREFAAVREAGFRTAATTRIGNLFPEHAALLHCLPRIPASGKLNRIEYFRASQSGLVPAIANRFRRVVAD